MYMNKREYDTISMQEILYLVSFLFLFGARAIGLYEGMFLYNITLVLGLLAWGIKILMTEHSILEYVVIGALVLLALIVYKNTGEKGILLYFTMMLGMKNVSVKRVFKCGFGILGVSYVTLIISSLLGINHEIMYIQHRSGWGDVFRRTLGYSHPNTLHSTYVILIVLIMYLVGKQNWKKLLSISAVLFGVSYYIYLYSGSRTGLLTTGIYLFVNFWFQTRKNISIVEKMGIYILYPACLVFSIMGPIVIKGKLFEIIDKILNKRWYLSIYYLKNEPITWLGTRFKEPPEIHYMIDSSFLYSFLQLGIVAFVIITFLYLCVIHSSIKKDARAELAIIVSFCIMGISDPFLFNLSYKNLIFLFIGEMIFQNLSVIHSKMPEVLKYSIQILKVGNKTVTYPKIYIGDKKWNRKDILQSICLYIIAFVCSIAVYSSVVEVPKAMYVSKEIWEDNVRRKFSQSWEGQGEEVYFTKDDIKQVKAKGELVVHYADETEPMYKVIGDAPRMEYKRNAVSVGVWSGVLALGLWQILKRRKDTLHS